MLEWIVRMVREDSHGNGGLTIEGIFGVFPLENEDFLLHFLQNRLHSSSFPSLNPKKISLSVLLYPLPAKLPHYFIELYHQKMSDPFPIDQFRDVFQITPKIKNKLQPFIAQYKLLNMQWIVNSLEQLHKYLFEDKIDITLKFNSIFGIKFLFDTAEVVLVNLIEVYFLPKILEIAGFDPKTNEEKRGTSYFAAAGYPKDTPDIEKLSYNFVRLSSEFIQAAASIKPKRIYVYEETDEHSEYFQAFLKLQDLGWKPYTKLAYYKDTVPAIAAQFKKNLEAFDRSADPYIDFYTDIFKVYLQKGKVYQGRLNPKKVLESGDVYITTPVIQFCVEAFRSNFIRQRLLAVGLLNDFVRWGDIEAAYQLNCSDMLDETLREIASKETGSVNLGRGKSLFANLESSEQQKQQFYVQFLKAIQFWSLCFPRAIKLKNRDSKIKLAHDQLRMKLKMEFPEDKNLKEHKMEFDRNIVKKHKRNSQLLEELENTDREYVSIIPARKSETKIESMKETPAPAVGDFKRIKASINQTNTCYNTLFENQATAHQKIQRIKKFKAEFDDNVERAEVDDQEFDDLIESGTPLMDKIEKIMPHLDRYTSKQITFKELHTAINTKSPTKSKVNIESPEKKEVKASLTHIKEESIKIEKPHTKEDISLKAEENSVKFDDKIKEALRSAAHIPLQVKPKVAQSLHQRVEQRESKVKIEGHPHNSLNHRAEEARKYPDSAQTPIKKMLEEREEFQDERSRSSLPSISKKSLEKSLDEHSIELRKNHHEEMNILPASHSIINSRESAHQNLFTDKHPQRGSLNERVHQERQQSMPNFSKKEAILHQLQEEIEDSEINKPKHIDNAKGSYKKNEGSRASDFRLPNELNKESRLSSHKGSRVDFQQSKIQKVQLLPEDDDDVILMPQDDPLEMSYHDIGGYEAQLKQNKQLSFKKCFEAEKYLLGANKNTKMFWLQKDTLNLIKPNHQRKSSRNKDSSINIPEILSEKDRKYQQELKYIEQQKNRKIKELEKKISNLESQGKNLQLKIVEQDRQIKSYKAESSVSNSRTKKNFYLEDQDQLFRAKVSQRNVRERDRSLYDQTRVKEPKCLEPQGKLISTRKYGDCFTSFSEEKRKKNLLKNKELLFKDSTIEFGCMSRKDGQTLLITFYITPEDDLEGLTYSISPVANSALTISIQPRHIASIRKRKQEKIFVSVNVADVPYHLPEIEFLYNLSGKMTSHRFTVPCSFHKFLHLEPTTEKQLASKFLSSKDIIRGQEVPYSKKLLKHVSSLAEYFTSGSLLREGQPNQNGEVEFGGRTEWHKERFWLRIVIKPSQFLCVQAAGENLSNAVEFYISLVTSLLMKNLQFSEIR